MGLNLKDEETVALVTEIAQRMGLTKTGAVRELARAKLADLEIERAQQHTRLVSFLESEIWPRTADAAFTKADRERLLGYDEMFEE